nr:hypothetical protein [Tanacetum cinerariifolium]
MILDPLLSRPHLDAVARFLTPLLDRSRRCRFMLVTPSPCTVCINLQEIGVEVDRLLAIRTPSPSPLTSYSSPLPQIPSPPLPTSPTDAVAPLGYRAAMIWLRAESPSTSHPLLLLPPIVLSRTRASMFMMRAVAPSTYILAPQSKIPSSGTPPLLPIPLPTSSPPLLLPSTDYKTDVLEVTLLPWKRLCISLDAGIRRDLDREIGYRITNVWEDPDEIAEEIPATDDNRFLMSGQLNLLRKDRCSHARTTRLMESEARASREAWVQSMHSSDTTRFETQMVTLQRQQRHARDLAHPNVSKEHVTLTEAGMAMIAIIQEWVVEGQNKLLIVGQDATHGMPWNTLMKMLTAKMFLEKSDKIEKYVGGLPDKIHGSVMASKPKTMQDAIEFATELMDKKIHTFAERQTKNKRKFKDTSRNNKNQQ